jgi:UPF0755 protein
MKPRNIFTCVVFIFSGVLLLAALALTLIVYFNSAPYRTPTGTDGISMDDSGSAVIEVWDGESSTSVGKRLFIAGIIRNTLFWNMLSRLESGYIKTGVYNIDLPISQVALYRILKNGRQKLIRLTIPEGVTLRKTAALLEDAGICSAQDFLRAAEDPALLDEYQIPGKTLEGYLYPDTYLFEASYPAESVVRKMADTFFSRLAELGVDRNKLTPAELYEKIIFASIIEREYRVADEAALIAGVFQNRLERGMRLESCATVEYIITEIQGKPHPSRLFNRDIQIQHPYNTYINSGLPPGPIAAPGALALKAAFEPEDSDFLFFRVVNPASKRHYFSKNFDEHIAAGELLVKGNL